MKAKWLKFKTRFESFKTSERLLLMGAFLALVYLIWEFLLMQPLLRQVDILETRERSAQQALQSAQAEYTVLSGLLERDPNAALSRELQGLRTQLQRVDQRLEHYAGALIGARDLPRVMHDMLQQAEPVHLLRVATLPKERVRTEPSGAQEDDRQVQHNPDALQLYRHGVRLEFEGSFHNVVHLLQSLEQSKAQFYWDNLDYQVSNFPVAKVVLNVFTLSTHRPAAHE